MTETLRLTLLGGLHIAHGETELEGAGSEQFDGVYPERDRMAHYRPVEGFVSRKAQALLVYLAVTGRAHFRDALAGLLWGESPEERAAGNLRVVLSNLRRLVPDHVIITRRTVEFNRESDCWIDVVEFESKMQEARGRKRADTSCVLQLATCLRLYQGDFLDGFYVRGAPDFEEWLLVERERLRQTVLQSLHCLVQHHVARGEYVAGIECVTRLLALDPWREEAHRELMRLLALSGQRSAALAQYEKCRHLLEAELGLEPLEETTALYQWLVDWGTGRLADWETGELVDWVISLPFRGRGDEHAQLVTWWEAALRQDSRQAQLALVEGEAGVGKTRLVEEAARYAEAQGAVVLRGRCYEFGGSVPYQPIAEALRTQIANNELRIANLGDVWLAELARLLPEVREMRPDLPSPIRGSGEAARQRLFEAVLRFLKQVASDASCLLFLDDLHWANQSTLDLLHYLVRQLSGAPVWIVGTYRPEEVSLSHPLTRLRQGLSRDHLVSRLILEPLSSKSVEEIACSLVGEEEGAAFGALLYQESEGNPFILVETVNDLQEQGVLRGEEGEHWQWSGPPAAKVLPACVWDVVLQRVGRLSEPAQRLLTLAAVIGRQFNGPLLQAAAGQDVDAVDESLDEWLTRRLVRQYPASSIQQTVSSLQYDFNHDKIRTAVYHAAGEVRRRMLHRRVGEALEQLFPGQTAEQVGLLAHHWEQAGEPEKAGGYLLRAGDRARLLYAHEEAIDYYRRALAYLKEQGQHEQAARTLMKLGLTYHNAFDFRQARRAYDEGFALWQRAGATQSVIPSSPAPHPLRVRWLEPTTLDPAMAPDAHTDCLMTHLFSGLVELTSEMDIVPDVAQTWEVSAGGRRFVFHLRDDVRWSDGTPVTAEDFEYAWKRVLAPATESPAASFLYDIKGGRAFHQAEGRREDVGVRALDDLTLLVELERPVGYLLQLLCHVSWYPVPRHTVEMHGAAWTEVGNLVTNGPFRLAAWKRGESLLLARNPTYHDWPRVRGNVQQVNLFPLRDWSARLQMYEADGLDVLGITFFPPAERDNARQQHIGEYISSLRLETHFLAFDVCRPPFDDVRVRRAFALATDRETLADVVMRGYVAPATGGLLPPGMPGHSPGIALPYDPQQARRLLAEAGYPGGRGFPVVDALGFRAAESRSEYLQAHWRENLGIEITWETVEWAEFLDRLGNETPHLTSLGWVADYPDPDSFLRVSRARSWAGWQNATYDRLVKEAGQVMCQGERMKLYRQADRILVEEAPILPLIYERDHLLVKPWVSRYPLSAIKPSFWKDVVIELH